MNLLKIDIMQLSVKDLASAKKVFETSIPDAFIKEGLALMEEDIQDEIANKKRMLEKSLNEHNGELRFLVAKTNDQVIGTISFGPCGSDILKCTDNELSEIGELGSLYVLPDFQDQGVGSKLIHALIETLRENDIFEFCLDSGYKRAQKRWIRKFGEPYKVVPDYWGQGYEHMIWLCKVD